MLHTFLPDPLVILAHERNSLFRNVLYFSVSINPLCRGGAKVALHGFRARVTARARWWLQSGRHPFRTTALVFNGLR